MDTMTAAAINIPAGISPTMTLEIGVCLIPHPEKAHKGGEDAFFISDCNPVFGEHPSTPLHPL